MRADGSLACAHAISVLFRGLSRRDTAGQERFRTITHNYYRGAHGIALVYDVTSTASFDNIKTWIAGVHKYADQDVAMALIGNKCDMTSSRAVSREEGQVLADHHGIAFFETSAKASINVDDAFNYLIRKVCDRLFSADGAAAGGAAGRSGAAAGQQQQQGQTVNLAESSNAKPEKSGSCC